MVERRKKKEEIVKVRIAKHMRHMQVEYFMNQLDGYSVDMWKQAWGHPPSIHHAHELKLIKSIIHSSAIPLFNLFYLFFTTINYI